MKRTAPTMSASALLVIGILAGSAAQAANSWNFDTACTSSNAVVTNNCGITEFTMYGMSSGSSAGVSTTTMSQAAIYDWHSYGLGIVNRLESPTLSDPGVGPHAADNVSGVDGFVFKFNQATNLNSFAIGWNGTDNATGSYADSDVSVFAWVGAGAPTTGADGSLVMASGGSGLLNSGWKLVGNFADVGVNTNGEAFTAANADSSLLYSNYWMVSGYDTSFGTSIANSSSTPGGTLGAGNDAFKLLTMGATGVCTNTVTNGKCVPGQTPEPNSLALMGLAVLGLWATRRRWSGAAQQGLRFTPALRGV
jgi:hypothetical protein